MLDDPDKKDLLIKDMLATYTAVDKEELISIVQEIEFQRKHEMFPEKNPISEAELYGKTEVVA